MITPVGYSKMNIAETKSFSASPKFGGNKKNAPSEKTDSYVSADKKNNRKHLIIWAGLMLAGSVFLLKSRDYDSFIGPIDDITNIASGLSLLVGAVVCACKAFMGNKTGE